MKAEESSSRREFIRIGSATIVAIPLLGVAIQAQARTNAGQRKALHYRKVSNTGKDCDDCVQFVPGKTAKSLGGCKLMPGDTEISPHGSCIAFAPKPE